MSEIKAAIIQYCDDHGLDPSKPTDIGSHLKEIWLTLGVKELLKEGMSFQAFLEHFKMEAVNAQQLNIFERLVDAVTPRHVKDVPCEVE